MLEQQILAASMADRGAYEKIERHIDYKEFSPHVGFWYKALAGYYARDKRATSADRDVLKQLGEQGISNPKHRDAILAALPESNDGVSIPNVVTAALGLLRTNRSAEFATAALSGDTKKASQLLETLNDLYSKEGFEEDSERIYASPIEELFERVGSEKRIPILPQSLNTRIGGGLLPGHHALIFGRTESGKTTFVINLIAGFIKQKQRVLYVGNEDPIDSIKARCVCRITGKSIQEVEADKASAIATYIARGGEDLLRLVHNSPGTIAEIEKEVQDFRPNVIVLDQIRNLSSGEDGMTRRLEANAIMFRALLSKYQMIGVSVAQASDKSDRNSADSPIYLSAGDVDSSRVGLPGTADLQIGIGGNAEMISRGQRMLSISKNKLHNGPQSREPLIVEVDLARSIVK